MPARHERQADVRSSARRRRHATWHRYADGVADAQAVAVGQNDLDGLRASGAFGQWWRFHFVRLCWCCIDHAHWHKRRRRSRTEPALVHLTPQGDRISKQCEQLGGKAVIAPRARELAAQGVTWSGSVARFGSCCRSGWMGAVEGQTRTAMGHRGEQFKGRQFTAEVIPRAVRWYLQFPFSYRHLELNEAERLAHGPAMRAVVGRQGLDRAAASTSQVGGFETEWLTGQSNLAAPANLSDTWIDRVHARRPQTTTCSIWTAASARRTAPRMVSAITAISPAHANIRCSCSTSSASWNDSACGQPLANDDVAGRLVIVRHGRSITCQKAEVMVPRDLFQIILDAIAALRPLLSARYHDTGYSRPR